MVVDMNKRPLMLDSILVRIPEGFQTSRILGTIVYESLRYPAGDHAQGAYVRERRRCTAEHQA